MQGSPECLTPYPYIIFLYGYLRRLTTVTHLTNTMALGRHSSRSEASTTGPVLESSTAFLAVHGRYLKRVAASYKYQPSRFEISLPRVDCGTVSHRMVAFVV